VVVSVVVVADTFVFVRFALANVCSLVTLGDNIVRRNSLHLAYGNDVEAVAMAWVGRTKFIFSQCQSAVANVAFVALSYIYATARRIGIGGASPPVCMSVRHTLVFY